MSKHEELVMIPRRKLKVLTGGCRILCLSHHIGRIKVPFKAGQRSFSSELLSYGCLDGNQVRQKKTPMASGAIRAKAKRAATYSLAEFSGSRLRARSMAFAMTLGSSLPKPELKKCALCGDTRNVQGDHLGGGHHVAWFTMPFCAEWHSLFHAMVTGAEIDLSYTHDPIERFRRALAAIQIANGCRWSN